MTPSNTAVIHVGRLLEIRADAGYRTAADVDQLFDAMAAEIARHPLKRRYVTVIDWRRCPVMSPAAAQCMVKRIVATNENVVRSAALARKDAPIAVLQFVRLIRETNQPGRRLFFDAGELVEWLSEVLTAPEQARLRLCLDQPTVRGRRTANGAG